MMWYNTYAYDKEQGTGDAGRRDGQRDGSPQVTLLTKITGPISEIGIEGTIQIGLPGRLHDNDLRRG